MIKAVLIDDEEIAIKELEFHLQSFGNISVVGAFTNPYEGFFEIGGLRPDVVFMDIDMPEISGIYLAEQIVERYDNISIIFVTAYDKYAVNAFELHALDYILKPISAERIKKSIMRLEENKRINIKEKISFLSERYEETVRKFFVQENDDIVLVNPANIYYIEALNKDVKIRTDTKLFTLNRTLKYYENKVKNLNFLKVHRSYIINLDKVAKISPRINYSFDVHFEGITDFVPVSRGNVKILRRLLEL
mgnify:CR=1 FL=1